MFLFIFCSEYLVYWKRKRDNPSNFLSQPLTGIRFMELLSLEGKFSTIIFLVISLENFHSIRQFIIRLGQ